MSKATTEEKIRVVLDGMRCPEGITVTTDDKIPKNTEMKFPT